jgi:hypothetical protein
MKIEAADLYKIRQSSNIMFTFIYLHYLATYGCEMLRLQHFLDTRLTDGGEVVIFKLRPPFTRRQEDY